MRPAAAEHAGEQRLEVPVHLLEHRGQPLPPLAVQVADGPAQLGDGGGEFLALGVDRGDALFHFARLDLGAEVHRAHVLAFLDQALVAVAGLGLRFPPTGRRAVRAARRPRPAAPGCVRRRCPRRGRPVARWPRRAPPARAQRPVRPRRHARRGPLRPSASPRPPVRWRHAGVRLRRPAGSPAPPRGGRRFRRARLPGRRIPPAPRRAGWRVPSPGPRHPWRGPASRCVRWRCADGGRRGRRARAPACRVRCGRRFPGCARHSARHEPAPPRRAARSGRAARLAPRAPGPARPRLPAVRRYGARSAGPPRPAAHWPWRPAGAARSARSGPVPAAVPTSRRAVRARCSSAVAAWAACSACCRAACAACAACSACCRSARSRTSRLRCCSRTAAAVGVPA